MGVLNSILRVFTWWNNGRTLGTQLYTWRKGARVGADDQGNVYYQSRDAVRRWVIFKDEIEASRIPADWHGWLHHTFADPPTDKPLAHKTWEKPHQTNLTGTAKAYAPAGSIRQAKPADRSDYEAWQPE